MSPQASPLRRVLRLLKKLALFGASAVLLVVVLFAFAVVTAPSPPKPHAPGPLAITSVQIVDAVSGSLSNPQTVLVDGGRIVAIDDPGSVAIPKDVRQLDGTGPFLIPGLWDMHAHWATPAAPQLTMPLFIAHGVTGVREMGGMLPLEQKRHWQDELAAEKLVGPRVVGQAVTFANRVESADEVREMVALVERPREFIKVYTRLRLSFSMLSLKKPRPTASTSPAIVPRPFPQKTPPAPACAASSTPASSSTKPSPAPTTCGNAPGPATPEKTMEAARSSIPPYAAA